MTQENLEHIPNILFNVAMDFNDFHKNEKYREILRDTYDYHTQTGDWSPEIAFDQRYVEELLGEENYEGNENVLITFDGVKQYEIEVSYIDKDGVPHEDIINIDPALYEAIQNSIENNSNHYYEYALEVEELKKENKFGNIVDDMPDYFFKEEGLSETIEYDNSSKTELLKKTQFLEYTELDGFEDIKEDLENYIEASLESDKLFLTFAELLSYWEYESPNFTIYAYPLNENTIILIFEVPETDTAYYTGSGIESYKVIFYNNIFNNIN